MSKLGWEGGIYHFEDCGLIGSQAEYPNWWSFARAIRQELGMDQDESLDTRLIVAGHVRGCTCAGMNMELNGSTSGFHWELITPGEAPRFRGLIKVWQYVQSSWPELWLPRPLPASRWVR